MRRGTRSGDAHSLRDINKLAKNHDSIDSAKTDNSIAAASLRMACVMHNLLADARNPPSNVANGLEGDD